MITMNETRLRSLRITLVVLLSSCWACWLQAGEPPKDGRTCRVAFIKQPADAPANLLMSDGTATRKIDLPGISLSRPYPIPSGDLALRFAFDAQAMEGEGGAKVKPVRIPSGWSRVYVLLEGTPEQPGTPLIARAFDASPGKLKAGGMFWINLTDLRVTGKVGERTIQLAPQSRVRIEPPAAQAGDYEVRLDMASDDGDAPALPLCRSRWRYEEKVRMLVLIVAEAGRTAPRIMSIPDCAPEK